MKNSSILKKASLLVVVLLTFGCESVLIPDDLPNNQITTFEALWTYMDEYYCYFDYKNVDWDSIKLIYEPQVTNEISDEALFEVCANMLNELRDGHTNLYAPFRESFYDNAFLYPANFNYNTIVNNYLIQGSTPTWKVYPSFEVALLEGDILYVNYGSFANEVDAMSEIIEDYPNTNGMILDVRNNGGGGYDLELAAYFTETEKLVAYYTQKNGPGHNDFTPRLPVTVQPNNDFYNQDVIVLTNRGCYSATSNFVQYMKSFDNVIQVGDTTGGGAGSPHDYDLPNGWTVRASHSPFYGVDGFNFEEGTPPDITAADDPLTLDEDEIIEKALEMFD